MSFQESHLCFTFVFLSLFIRSCENELDRRREDVAKGSIQLLVIVNMARAAFFLVSSIAMIYCGTRG